jgi:hypothetical protein
MKSRAICILVCCLFIVSAFPSIGNVITNSTLEEQISMSNLELIGMTSLNSPPFEDYEQLSYPLLNIDEYDLLIIAPDDWKDDLEPLKQHKENHEISTIVVGLNEIYAGEYFLVEGRDDAEKVKYFIKNAFDEWNITYVLLVGGRKPGITEKWFVPVRYVGDIDLLDEIYLSDLYFADIYDNEEVFQSWDSNEDNIFGTQKDDIDLYPEVYVGRWACRRIIDLHSIVEKTIEYENTPMHSKKIVLVGGDGFEDDEEFIEGELITESTVSCLPGYEPIRVYASNTDVTSNNIREALGEGASFMHFNGHSWITYWSVYKHNQFDEPERGLGIWNLPLFSNTEFPIVVLGGCRTAQFNVAVFNRPSQLYEPPPLAKYFPAFVDLSWAFARKINGGSVATLGYTIPPMFGFGETGDLDNDGIEEPDCIETGYGFLEPAFFCAYGVEGKTILGECWKFALDKYIEAFAGGAGFIQLWHIRTIHGFVLLGDPSLKIGGYS